MGRKKKSVANKLAKMSEDERARYLQHKADMEEEARRRKEQLISTFMKNKMKREDGFSRLNVAKINQHWHQTLRKAKCTEMKENVEHMKRWIDRVINLKNKIIDKLLKELDEAELQYAHNLKYHITWIDNIIQSHNGYLRVLQDDYEEEVTMNVESLCKEVENYSKNSEEDQNHLKTIIYGQDIKMEADLRAIEERYKRKHDDLVCTSHGILEKTVKDLEGVLGTLWRRVAEVVKEHMQYTDLKRAHFAELKRLDADSSAEIGSNQDHINNQQDEYECLMVKREQEIKNMEKEIKGLSAEFSEMRRVLQGELLKDEKKLRYLSEVSNKSIGYLEKVVQKGSQIKFLMNTCSKLETDKDKIIKYLPLLSFVPGEICQMSEHSLEDLKKDLDSDENVIIQKEQKGFVQCDKSSDTNAVTNIGRSMIDSDEKSLESQFYSRLETDFMKTMQDKSFPRKLSLDQHVIRSSAHVTDSVGMLPPRPSTAVARKFSDTAFQDKEFQSTTTYSEVASGLTESGSSTIEETSNFQKVVIKQRHRKMSPKCSAPSSSADDKRKMSESDVGTVGELFSNLRHMERLWSAFNKVELDCMELKAERKTLALQNKQLRGMLRGVLEAMALAHTIPSTRVSTRVTSRTRTALSRSAPPSRLVL